MNPTMRAVVMIFNNQRGLQALILNNTPALLSDFAPQAQFGLTPPNATNRHGSTGTGQDTDTKPRGSNMSRKFIASIIAASIAITGFAAAPAKADSSDLARFLAGATALVIIGQALDDNRSLSRSSVNYYRFDDRHHHDGHRSRGHHRGHRDANVDSPKRLPPGCLTRVDSRHGSRQVFGEACLNVHYLHNSTLPRACRTRNRHEGPRVAYDATCLFDRGYRAATR